MKRKANELKGIETEELFCMVPIKTLQAIKDDLSIIKENLQLRSDEPKLGKYIPESEAKKLINRKTTWFWRRRAEGKLKFSKVGSQVFYYLPDLEKMIEENQQDSRGP